MMIMILFGKYERWAKSKGGVVDEWMRMGAMD
jgi:hypothetical protein